MLTCSLPACTIAVSLSWGTCGHVLPLPWSQMPPAPDVVSNISQLAGAAATSDHSELGLDTCLTIEEARL